MRRSFAEKLVFCAVLAVLVLSFAANASATTAKLVSTQNFLSFLDEKDIEYTYAGPNDGDDERVTVSYTLNHYSSLACTLIFDKDDDEVDLRIWNIATVSAGKNYTLSTLQKLNAGYKFCKFVLDESDSTLQAEMDMFIDKDHCVLPVCDAMYYMFTVLDDDTVAGLIQSLE